MATYERKYEEDPTNIDNTLGRIRCLNALGEWDSAAALARQAWKDAHDSSANVKKRIAHEAAKASWNVSDWKFLEELVHSPAGGAGSIQSTFFKALLCVHSGAFREAQEYITQARDAVDVPLAALVAESYDRAYEYMITVQQLSELEEVIQYKKELEAESAARAAGIEEEYSQLAPRKPEDGPLPPSRLKRHDIIKRSWQQRLEGCQRDVDVWQRLLGVRSLVIPAEENLATWLKFVKVCQQSGRFKMSHQVLASLMGGGAHSPRVRVWPRLVAPGSSLMIIDWCCVE